MFKQIKNVMCRASINGSNEMTMIAIPFENIAAFDHMNQNTIENLCSLKEVEAEE